MRDRLREIAKETVAAVESGSYRSASGQVVTIGPAVAAAVAGTRMFGPSPVAVPSLGGRTSVIEVTGESSTAAARRLAEAGEVAVLNFASARNPGGGFQNGAQAQEEALCRASALYATLLRVPEFYAHHRDPFYSDRVIYSPAVPVFRDDQDRLLDEPFVASFLTSAAPNAGVIAADQAGRIPATLARRAERVLEVAAANGARGLVLGAWGCGVFRNDPAQVAGAFHTLLGGRFAGHFAHVVFAILERSPDAPRRAAFSNVFAA